MASSPSAAPSAPARGAPKVDFMSDEDLEKDWKPNARRPQSYVFLQQTPWTTLNAPGPPILVVEPQADRRPPIRLQYHCSFLLRRARGHLSHRQQRR